MASGQGSHWLIDYVIITVADIDPQVIGVTESWANKDIVDI